MTTAVVCTGLLGLLVFGLGFAVSGTRGRTGTNFGFTPDPADPLYRLVRAHGNATEYSAMLAVLMLFVGARGPATWMLVVMGVTTAARYLHVVGMLTGPGLDRLNPFRFAGALFTYLGGITMSVALLIRI